MSIKILHTSDIHLESKLGFLGENATEQRETLVTTFENLIQLALSENYKLVLVAGDLFDTPYPSQVVKTRVLAALKKLEANSIFTAIIAGNHDHLANNSVLNDEEFKFQSSKFIKIFKDDVEWKIPELDLTIYGVSALAHNNPSPLTKLKNLKPTTKNKIALLHGSVNIIDKSESNLDIEELKKLGMDYIALGDWHSTLEVSKSPAIWYSGSPELVNISQQGAGNYLEIILDNGKSQVSKKTVGERSVLKLEIDVTGLTSLQELKSKIDSSLQENKNNLFLDLTLVGTKALDANFEEESLMELLDKEVFYLKIKDKSKIELSDEDLSKLPEDTLIGKYVRLLKEKKGEDYSQNKIIDEAIQLGIQKLRNS